MGAHHKFTELSEQIGQKIKQARSVMCITQTGLANQVGVSYQQIQKYENGKSQIAAEMLYKIAKAIHIPVRYFFKGLKLKSKK